MADIVSANAKLVHHEKWFIEPLTCVARVLVTSLVTFQYQTDKCAFQKMVTGYLESPALATILLKTVAVSVSDRYCSHSPSP